MMKKNIYRLRVVCAVMLALFCTTSCNDWLEVKPKTEEEADNYSQHWMVLNLL